MAALIFGLLLFFVLGIYVFRTSASIHKAKREKDHEPVATSAEKEVALHEQAPIVIPLHDVEGGVSQGQATRSKTENEFHLAMHAALPPIDRANIMYKAWLVSRAPFDYVSAGELVKDETGAFVLDWDGEKGKEYATYSLLVVTRQSKNTGNDPGVHVLEGIFLLK